MSDNRSYRLGDLQLRILQILWELGSATVAQVHGRLGYRWAYTTVATMLRKMEDRHLVRHRRTQRRLVYAPLVSAAEVSQHMANDLVERLFEGSLASAVSHLLESRDVTLEELHELEQIIREHKRNCGLPGTE